MPSHSPSPIPRPRVHSPSGPLPTVVVRAGVMTIFKANVHDDIEVVLNAKCELCVRERQRDLLLCTIPVEFVDHIEYIEQHELQAEADEDSPVAPATRSTRATVPYPSAKR
ncbi:hypothetical protein G6O69_19395 [Pseudenhygromyxa sp. WMMC2535]|uniref:hypothetical protein n=1 Tax=Pseudenhygromyxa sp. WMMC2535 TaxID=2712867 RepID=UPI0015569314|nr:hypothetical protein [Pseudenhygromyxa sp. WMMC2535]NVB40019.1 hypothetical protein [Pseudenhygromyxa sp. WMMC2535]